LPKIYTFIIENCARIEPSKSINIIGGAMRKAFFIFILAAFLALPDTASGIEGNPLTLSYSGGTGKGSSISKFVENTWSYRYQYHVLVLSGDVQQGRLFSQIQLEERDYNTGLTFPRLSLS